MIGNIKILHYITTSEYAQLHNRTPATIRYLIYTGKLQAVKQGRDIYIDEKEPYPVTQRRTKRRA